MISLLKQICLLTIGAVISVIAVKFSFSLIMWAVTIISLAVIYFALDYVPIFINWIKYYIRNRLRVVAILAPHDVDDETAGWVHISMRQITSELNKIGYRIAVINETSKIFSYSFVINPYGSKYLEEDLENFTNLEAIKRYIINGGIFLNIADIPFYYAYSSQLKKSIDTTPLLNSLSGLRLFNDSLLTRKFFVKVFNSESYEYKLEHQDVKRTFVLSENVQNMIDKDYIVHELGDEIFDQNGEAIGRQKIPNKTSPFVAIALGRGYLIVSSIELTILNLSYFKDVLNTSLNLKWGKKI